MSSCAASSCLQCILRTPLRDCKNRITKAGLYSNTGQQCLQQEVNLWWNGKQNQAEKATRRTTTQPSKHNYSRVTSIGFGMPFTSCIVLTPADDPNDLDPAAPSSRLSPLSETAGGLRFSLSDASFPFT